MAENNPEHVKSESSLRSFFRLSLDFWKGPEKWVAWRVSLLVVITLAAQLAMQVILNYWNRSFFDALEAKNMDAIWVVISTLPLIIIGWAISFSTQVVARMLFQTRWRAWLTNSIAGWWIADQRYYRLGLVAPQYQAPEYRIAEDIRLTIEPLVDFVIGIFSALITAITFSAILWNVAGALTVHVGGQLYIIPAYTAIAAVLYAIFATCFAYLTGLPLISRVAAKNESEALFRAELTRLRENAESIALIRGDNDELSLVKATYARVVKNWLGIIRQQGIVQVVLSTNSVIVPIIPLLLCVPKYMAGELSLGGVMQIVAAFSAVQGALLWFVDNVVRLAEWYASVQRVHELTAALEAMDISTENENDNHITLGTSDDGAIHLENLSIAEMGGRIVINEASTIIHLGEKVFVTGKSGVGKSILIRAIAGLWPWGSGEIRLPEGVQVTFVPQTPYLPLGSLRDALVYPKGTDAIDSAIIEAAMERCGLKYLIKRLDDVERWDQALSGGELQRIGFARLIIQKPGIIIMDESTSALDEHSQQSLLSLFHDELKQCTIITVGHRTGIEEFHERKITLERHHAGAGMVCKNLRKGSWHKFFSSGFKLGK